MSATQLGRRLGDQAHIMGGVGQLNQNAIGILGFVRVEHAGANAHPDFLGVIPENGQNRTLCIRPVRLTPKRQKTALL